MTDGVTIEEENKQDQKQLQVKIDTTLGNETDLMSNIINKRKEEVDQIAAIMNDINHIA